MSRWPTRTPVQIQDEAQRLERAMNAELAGRWDLHGPLTRDWLIQDIKAKHLGAMSELWDVGQVESVLGDLPLKFVMLRYLGPVKEEDGADH